MQKKVLICDDSPVIRMVLEGHVKHIEGVCCDFSESGELAIKLLSSNQYDSVDEIGK